MAKHSLIAQLLKNKTSYTIEELSNKMKKTNEQVRDSLIDFLYNEVNSLASIKDNNKHKYVYKIFKYIDKPSSEEEKEYLLKRLSSLSNFCLKKINTPSSKNIRIIQEINENIENVISKINNIDFDKVNEYYNMVHDILDYVIFELNDYECLIRIIERLPKKAIIVNKNNEYLINKIVGKYINEIINDSNHERIVYYDKIIRLFVDSSKIDISLNEKEMILYKFKDAIKKISLMPLTEQERKNKLYLVNDIVSCFEKSDAKSDKLKMQIEQEINYYKKTNYNPKVKGYIISYLISLLKYIDAEEIKYTSIEKYIQSCINAINGMNLPNKQKYSLSYLGDEVAYYVMNYGYKNNKLPYLNYKYEIENIFNEKVLEESKRTIDYENDEVLDLTNECVLTIDNPGTIHQDDAVSIKKLENDMILLSVFIADVASYVPRESSIDETAKKRINSIYIPKSSIPMLPDDLTNKIALNQNSKRKAYGYFFLIDRNMQIVDFNIKKCLINVTFNLSYDEANSIITNTKNIDGLGQLKELYDVSKKLHFTNNVLKVLTKSSDKSSKALNSDCASNLISDFMILTNSQIANYFNEKSQVPFIYKNSVDRYDKEVISRLNSIIDDNAKYRSLSTYIGTMVPSSYYSTISKGNHGLKLDAYCNATNPLRNYASLEIERIISDTILNNRSIEDLEKRKKELQELCDYINIRMIMNDDYLEERKKEYRKTNNKSFS